MYNIEEILNKCDFVETVSEFIDIKPKGKDFTGECPMCHQPTLNITAKKASRARRPGMVKCFKCDFGTTSLIEIIENVKGWNTGETIKYLAQKTGCEPIKEEVKPKLKPKATSFKNRKLAESGLEIKDIKALETCEDGTVREMQPFDQGTINEYWNVVDGDDIIIRYLDIDGKQLKYETNRGKLTKDFIRVRWQVPESHTLANGDTCKYKSPYKSGVQIYIPETTRQIFKGNHTSETLYLTEGELKAEKMCKHGMPAFGLGGINSIAGKERQFPDCICRFIERCGVKNVVLLADSDWDQLSDNLTSEKPADSRPRSFAGAIKNFRDWFASLAKRELYLNLYFVGLKDTNFKGVDDLLTLKLNEREHEFQEDIRQGMLDKQGRATHCTVIKVSSITDSQVYQIFALQSPKDFAARHHEKLSKLEIFKIGYNKWRFNADGEIEPAQPIMSDEQFWETRTIGEGEKKRVEYSFKYHRFHKFLMNRGFWRYRKPDGKVSLIFIENNIVKEVDHIYVRDFTLDLVESLCSEDCIDMMLRGSPKYFGPDSLSHIKEYSPEIVKAEKYSQNFYFKNKIWKINHEGIKETIYAELPGNIWRDLVKDFEPKRTEKMFNLELITHKMAEEMPSFAPYVGKTLIELTPAALECQFVKYIMLTSNMSWEKMYDDQRQPIAELSALSIAEKMEFNDHILSKITAFGYLLHDFRDKSHEKAIICMDAKITPVGDSHGRSGKSLFGMAIGEVISQCIINGKKSNMEDDNFLFEEVDERTRNIFIDDVKTGFDLEFLFPVITGILPINGKGLKKVTFKNDQVPKLIITTNHAINGSSSSFKDRQFKIAFSDFFSDEYKPIMEFCNNFFYEWDFAEWNRFYNFIVECIQTYLLIGFNAWGQNGSGLIAAPAQALEKRRLRQEIHETFFQWANEFYGIDDETTDVLNLETENLNMRIDRRIIYDHFINNTPKQTQKYITTPNEWKKRLLKWCEYHGLRLNPRQSDAQHSITDKTNGIEYITIANNRFSS